MDRTFKNKWYIGNFENDFRLAMIVCVVCELNMSRPCLIIMSVRLLDETAYGAYTLHVYLWEIAFSQVYRVYIKIKKLHEPSQLFAIHCISVTKLLYKWEFDVVIFLPCLQDLVLLCMIIQSIQSCQINTKDRK